MSEVTLSVVVPVYSGEPYLRKLCDKFAELKQKWQDGNYPVALIEAVFVDDGSIDNSSDVLRELAAKYDWVRVSWFSKNFGQHPATVAGILYTSGDWIATLDEDLQHDPKFIEQLLRRAVTEHLDIIYAKSSTSANSHSWFRDYASKGFKKFVGWVTRNQHIESFNSFRLIRGDIARSAASVAGHAGYLDIAFCWFTSRFGVEKVPLVDIRFQETQKSGYSFTKLLTHAKRMMFSSNTLLLRWCTLIGSVAMVLSAMEVTSIFWRKLVDQQDLVRGWASLAVLSLFFGGMILFLLGIISEYLSVVCLHAQGKPTYFEVNRENDFKLKKFFEATT